MDENFNKYVRMLRSVLDVNKNIIFFCIGTDRVIGDCLGPITGTLLKEKYDKNIIFGDLDENVTYENIEEKLNEINSKFNNPYIIAIDAALSTKENVGKIFLDNNGIDFGNCLGKNIGCVGNVGIKVVIGKDYDDPNLNFKILQNVSLSEVIKLSRKTFEGISLILNK